MASQQRSTESRESKKRADVVAFGIILARFRKSANMTQEQLSWRSGIDRKFISRIENGDREPGLGTILKLAASLQISVPELMAAVMAELQRNSGG